MIASRMREVSIRLALCSALCAGALDVSAQGNQVAAEALFQQGTALMQEGRFADACPKLEESLRLDQALGTKLYLALCYEKVGRTATAWVTYKSAESAARNLGQTDRADKAAAQAQALEARLSRLTVLVRPTSVISGLDVKMDGVSIGSPSWGIAFPVDPGVHVLTAEAPGRQTFRTEVTVGQGGDHVQVEVPLLPDTPAAVAPTAPPPSPPSGGNTVRASPSPPVPATADHPGKTQRIIGGLLIGAGAVGGGVVGGLMVSKARSKDRESDQYCGPAAGFSSPNECNETGLALDADGRNARTGAVIGFGVGGGVLLTGIILVATAPGSKSRGKAPVPSALVTLTPAVSARSQGVTVNGRF